MSAHSVTDHAANPLPTAPDRDSRRLNIFLILAGAALLIGIIQASSLWYVNDDCFVSFRYAKNLVKGLGLVYNAEERVEGYTNFLWTMIIAGGLKFSLDPVILANVLGIAFFALTLALYAFLSWKFRSTRTPGILLIPFTTLALAFHRDFCAHATSGMETSMFSFLISAGCAFLLVSSSNRSALLSGLFFTLAMMTRPDGIVFFAAAALCLIIARKPASRLLMLGLPVLAIFVPYWIWRAVYYGFFFPNTFYAKSIDLPYYSQGLAYTWLYFKTYYLFLLLPPAAAWWYLKKKRRGNDADRPFSTDFRGESPLLLFPVATVLYILFVIRIGGDFMFARFFIAVTPMMFFTFELLLDRLVLRRRVHLLCAIVLLAATAVRWDQYGNALFVGYVADESRYFTHAHQEQSEADGALLHKYFEGIPVRLAFWAGQLKLVYYIDPVYAIESSGGLTDTAVAHRTLGARGRPGHEKQPTTDYLLSRNVHFYIGPVDPPPQGQVVLNAIVFDHILARIITYDNRIMSQLARFPEIRFVNIPSYLDRYLGVINTYPRDKVGRDFAYFTSFYFSHNSDPAREAAFRDYLAHIQAGDSTRP